MNKDLADIEIIAYEILKLKNAVEVASDFDSFKRIYCDKSKVIGQPTINLKWRKTNDYKSN